MSLFSSFYLCKPTQETIRTWKSLLSREESDFVRELRETLDRIDPASEQTLEDLLWEYTRLFIGPYKLPSPPWESVYASPRRLMMQEPSDEVRCFYNEAGLTMNNPDIMPDHVGAELNFLAVLYEKMESDPPKRTYYVQMGERFLNEHLRRWIPRFTYDVEISTESSFYKTLARLTRGLIMDHCDFSRECNAE